MISESGTLRYTDWNLELEAPPIPKHIIEEFERNCRIKLKKEIEESLTKAKHLARTEFYKRMMVQSHVADFCEEGKEPVEHKDQEIMDTIQRQSERLNTKPPYCLLTINIRPTVSLSELQKQVAKLLNKKTIKEYFYVYEVRKEDYTGLHCHMILRYTERPYAFKRSTKSTFKGLCDIDNSSCLNFKFIDEKLLKDKIDYLLGNKQDKKSQGVLFSKKFREKEKLQPFYESQPAFPCRVEQNGGLPLLAE